MLALGKNIRELRMAKKLTQKDLAQVLNVTPQAVSKWERDESNPDLETLLKLSHYFDVSVDKILGNKSKTFLASLFSKVKGSKQMEKGNRTKGSSQDKKVIIFDMVVSFIAASGQLQTQFLQQKLVNLLQEKQKDISVTTHTSNEVATYGPEADLILLTPAFAYAQAEVAKEFPQIPVLTITQKDYGLLNVETLYQEIVTLIG